MNATQPAERDGLFNRLLFGSVTMPSPLLDGILLFSRLYAGVTIASAGYDKLPTPDWMADQVTTIGFPFPAFSATAACLTEFVAGILLALGLFTRPAAFALAIVMGTAAFGFHKVTPITGMHIAQGFVWLFVVFLAIGGGRLSVDAIIRRMARSNARAAFALAGAFFVTPMALGLYHEFIKSPPPVVDVSDGLEVETLTMAGSFNDWSLDATPMVAEDGDVWRATFDIASPGIVEFKFVVNGSWDVNLGERDTEATTLPVEGIGEPNADNMRFAAPTPGRYTVTLNATSLVYRVTAAEAETPAP